MENKFKVLEESLRKDIKRTGAVIKKGKFTTYRNILYKGYLGDFETEWWTQKDWDNYYKDIKKLKIDGTYGEPWICELTLSNNPLFDNTSYKEQAMESYKMVLIDCSCLDHKTLDVLKYR